MNYFGDIIDALAIFICIVVIGCTSVQSHPVEDSVISCDIYYYKNDAPWVPDWFCSGTVDAMLRQECIVSSDSLSINRIKHTVDSLVQLSTVMISGAGKFLDGGEEIDTRYLVIFNYPSRSDTLSVGPVATSMISMHNRIFYSKEIYYWIVETIMSEDAEWGNLFNLYHKDSTFYVLPAQMDSDAVIAYEYDIVR